MTKTENQKPEPRNRIVLLLFAFLIVFVYFFGLTIPLVGPDEPRYAQVAREMFERNDFITPTLGGFNWFEKPALLYWLQMVAYKIFGVSEFAARFGSALFGLGTILSLWILGRNAARKSENVQAQTNPESGIRNLQFADWLAIVAASSIGLIVFARGASFDIILTFPITAALVAFFIFDQKDKNASATFHFSLFAFHFFIGVALLAKGLVGIVFPFAIVAFYHVLSRKLPSKTFLFSLLWGTILSLLIASVWYVPMYLRHGWTFIDEFFVQHHFERFASDKYQHAQPFWFFVLVLPLMTLPWLPFFAASLWDFIKRIFHRRDTENTEKNRALTTYHLPLTTFSCSWLLVPLVFFSFSGSKLPGYILPALPAALILTALSVFKFVQKSARRQFVLMFLAFLVLGAAALLLQFVVPRYAESESVKSLIETADARGFAAEKIVNLYVVSHNAEFYAAKRLVRDGDGKLKRFDDFSELVKELKRENKPQILVLVPTPAVENVTESGLVEYDVLAETNETTIVLIKPKN